MGSSGSPVSSRPDLTFAGKLSRRGVISHPPENMKEPGPPDDLERTILETFDEMHAEAQVAPIVLTLPPEVIESVVAYTNDHSVEPATLIPLAIEALEHQVDEFSEACVRLLEDPDSFAWPLEDPLLCVALAFMLKHACRCAEKVHEKHDFDEHSDEGNPTESWKTFS